VSDTPGKPAILAEPSYVLAARDYADIAHLENPNVIERILSGTRTEGLAYVGALLQSGVSRYVLAGPKVAVTAMAIEALTDLSHEIFAWNKAGRIPEDFSGRPSGYQTWVELLREIDSNPVDAERLKAMKAMFLAANTLNVTDGESIASYQLFQIAKRLASGELLLLRAIYKAYLSQNFNRQATTQLQIWAERMAGCVGHGLSALAIHDQRVLVDNGLITPLLNNPPNEVVKEADTGRLTDLGIRFCRNLEEYAGKLPGTAP
jgi:hypothetical protein